MADEKKLNYQMADDFDDGFTTGDAAANINNPGNKAFDHNSKISVVGVGGAGGNAVRHMTESGAIDINYIVANTDVGALRTMDPNKMARVQLGRKTLQGQGAGSDPSMGKASAEENIEDVIAQFEGSAMLFVAAGMGGGTGTGAAPVIAKAAKDKGILTIGVVTKPFHFEREEKMRKALAGIEEMRKSVDALVVIPNEKIRDISKNLTFRNAFQQVDDVLCRAVLGVSGLVKDSGYVGIDYRDVKTALGDAGTAHMALASAKGDKKIEDAVNQIVNCPLLETSIKGARRMLINVTISYDMLFDDVEQLVSKLTENGSPDVLVKYGVKYSDSLAADEIELMVVAADFDEPEPEIPFNIDIPDFPSFGGNDNLFASAPKAADQGAAAPADAGSPSSGGDFNSFLHIINNQNRGN